MSHGTSGLVNYRSLWSGFGLLTLLAVSAPMPASAARNERSGWIESQSLSRPIERFPKRIPDAASPRGSLFHDRINHSLTLPQSVPGYGRPLARAGVKAAKAGRSGTG